MKDEVSELFIAGLYLFYKKINFGSISSNIFESQVKSFLKEENFNYFCMGSKKLNEGLIKEHFETALYLQHMNSIDHHNQGTQNYQLGIINKILVCIFDYNIDMFLFLVKECLQASDFESFEQATQKYLRCFLGQSIPFNDFRNEIIQFTSSGNIGLSQEDVLKKIRLKDDENNEKINF